MRRADFLISVGLIALVAAVFLQTLGDGYLGYDDPFYVTDNPLVQRGLTWDGTVWAFVRSHEAGGTWAPLTFLTHMLDCQLYGMNPAGHHASNVILHAANSVILYFALLALAGARWPSAVAAALFAIHPLHVESAAWIAERKDLMSGFFFMLCLWAYALYARRPGIGRYLLMSLALLLGLMSKPMLVTMPPLLLVLDYWPLKRTESWKRLVWEKAPLMALALATALLTVATQRSAGFVRSLDQFPLTFRITNTIVSYARYVAKTFWPFDLAAYYPAPPRWSIGVVAGCALLLVAITFAAVVMRRRAPWLAVGWSWFLGMLVPVIGLVQVGRQAMADRYSYLPHIGLFIAIAWSAAALTTRWGSSKPWITAITSLVLLALTIRSIDQARHWTDTETLARHALQVTENNNVALVLVANARRRAGDFNTAEALYRQALAIEPGYGMAHLNLGNLLVRRRDFAGAAEHFEAAIRWRPQLERAHLGLGIALRGLREYDGSDQAFAEALRLSPRLAEAQLAWGLSLQEQGRSDEARQRLIAALKTNPNLDFARRALAEINAAAAARASPTTPSTPSSLPAPASP